MLFLSNDLRDSFASCQAGLAPKAGPPKTSVGLRTGQDSKGVSCLSGVTLAAKACFLPEHSLDNMPSPQQKHLPGKTP